MLYEEVGGLDGNSKQLIKDSLDNLLTEQNLLSEPKLKTVAALYPDRRDKQKIGLIAAGIAGEEGIELEKVTKYVNGEQRPVNAYSKEQEWIVHEAVRRIDQALN